MIIDYYLFIVCLYLIDGEPDGVEVSPEGSLPASVFLHQTNQDSAAVLAIVRVIVDILQPDEELRVGAERGCREKTGGEFITAAKNMQT